MKKVWPQICQIFEKSKASNFQKKKNFHALSPNHAQIHLKMGPKNDPTAVVDDNLKVYGLNNLRVIDASIMPTMLSANLHSGATLIGEKGSDLVLGKDPIDPIVLNY